MGGREEKRERKEIREDTLQVMLDPFLFGSRCHDGVAMTIQIVSGEHPHDHRLNFDATRFIHHPSTDWKRRALPKMQSNTQDVSDKIKKEPKQTTAALVILLSFFLL